MFGLYRMQYAQNILNITSAVRGVTETGEAKTNVLFLIYTNINTANQLHVQLLQCSNNEVHLF
jgi:hypothetical protein